jgi:PH (Pleckstrin Homology) domain-containing protein
MSAAPAAPLARRAFRNHFTRICLAALLALPAVFFSIFALDVGPPPKVDDPVTQAVSGAIALVFWVVAVRTWRIGVFTGPDGVTVRGVARTWRLRWADVLAFEEGTWRGPGAYPATVVRRMDHSQVTVLALNATYDPSPEELARLQSVRRDMNGELDKARAAGLAGAVARDMPVAAAVQPRLPL